MPYKKTPYFQSYSPRARVLIRDINTWDETYDLSDDITSLSTTKAYGRCSGAWTLTLPDRQWQSFGEQTSYFKLITPDTIITIEMDPGDGTGFLPVMIGMVDRVAMQWQASPIPKRIVSVSGRDLGKILEKHHIGWVPSAAAQRVPTTAGDMKDWVGFTRPMLLQAGTAATLIQTLYEWLSEDLPAYTSRIGYHYNTTNNQMLYAPQVVGQMEESAWDAMKRVANEPFNMLTTDTDTTDVTTFNIILEDQPIDSAGRLSREDAERIHQIDEQDIISYDLGISDAERVNILLYKTQVSMLAENGAGTLVAYAHPGLGRVDDADDNKPAQHGFCARVEESRFVDPDDIEAKYNRAADFANYITQLDKLWSWRKTNHQLSSGTMQVHLRPDIRAGHCLIAKDYNSGDYYEYLVEQVSHQCVWNPMPQFITTLQLTRGQKTTPLKLEAAAK